MYKNKKNVPVFISEYDTYEKIAQLNKTRSPVTILLCTNDLPDKWFIDVIEYRTKTGLVTNSYTITSKDMLRHIKFRGHFGYYPDYDIFNETLTKK